MPNRVTLKTAIIVDQMGHGFGTVGPEEEIEEHKKDFSELLFPAQLDVYTPYSTYPGDLKPGTDLVVFDYGGMMMGNSLMEDNSRHLITFAQDNPNTLCIVASTTTWSNGIRYMTGELEIGALHNLVCRYWMGKASWESDYSAEDEQPELWDPIPAWFRQLHKLPRDEWWLKGPAKAAKLKTPRKTK